LRTVGPFWRKLGFLFFVDSLFLPLACMRCRVHRRQRRGRSRCVSLRRPMGLVRHGHGLQRVPLPRPPPSRCPSVTTLTTPSTPPDESTRSRASASRSPSSCLTLATGSRTRSSCPTPPIPTSRSIQIGANELHITSDLLCICCTTHG